MTTNVHLDNLHPSVVHALTVGAEEVGLRLDLYVLNVINGAVVKSGRCDTVAEYHVGDCTHCKWVDAGRPAY